MELLQLAVRKSLYQAEGVEVLTFVRKSQLGIWLLLKPLPWVVLETLERLVPTLAELAETLASVATLLLMVVAVVLVVLHRQTLNSVVEVAAARLLEVTLT